jgi:hypothetical protein
MWKLDLMMNRQAARLLTRAALFVRAAKSKYADQFIGRRTSFRISALPGRSQEPVVSRTAKSSIFNVMDRGNLF